MTTQFSETTVDDNPELAISQHDLDSEAASAVTDGAQEPQSPPQIGELLKELRGKDSLRELHRRTGIALAHLSQIESGGRTPGLSVLRRLADFHGIRLGELLERAGYDDAAPENLEDEEIANIERSYRFVIDDPKLRSCVKPEPPPPLDTKRFIVEIYQKCTGKQIL